MDASQLAAITYTLRSLTTSADATDRIFGELKSFGYAAIEACGVESMDDAALRAAAERHGLRIVSSHCNGATLVSDPASLVPKARALGISRLVYPFPHRRVESTGDLRDWIGGIANAGEVLAAAGIQLCYHNHHHEFRRLDGRTLMDWLADEIPATALAFELDTYWVQFGGGSPVAWLERLAGRVPLLHLKDYQVDAETKPAFAEMGAGNLDWAGIFRAAAAAGVEWYIVEQDTTPGDPLDSVRQSADWLKATHLKGATP